MKELRFVSNGNKWLLVDRKGAESFDISISKFRVVGHIDNLTEEQASEVVYKSMCTGLYGHYVENVQLNSYCYTSAIQSLHSLFKSKGIHLHQRGECNNVFCDNGRIDMSYGEFTSCFDCETIEEKTFYNPVLFKIL